MISLSEFFPWYVKPQEDSDFTSHCFSCLCQHDSHPSRTWKIRWYILLSEKQGIPSFGTTEVTWVDVHHSHRFQEEMISQNHLSTPLSASYRKAFGVKRHSSCHDTRHPMDLLQLRLCSLWRRRPPGNCHGRMAETPVTESRLANCKVDEGPDDARTPGC